ALQNLDVTFAIDRGGIVGADGATHQGAFDLSYLTCIPNMVVMAPADEAECRRMLTTAYRHPGPAAVRYPRGAGPAVPPAPILDTIPLGKGELRRQGKGVAILAFGTLLSAALEAGEALDATVANMRFVKPLDTELVLRLSEAHDVLVTVEENAVIGGAGAEVARALENAGRIKPLLRLGLPDRFIEHGEQSQMLAELGLSGAAIADRIRQFVANLT
ncbi:MAG: transketolase C-terminal domain-containing protein, partial [Rhodocyclaceae bacterium]